jgi:hypothetical protein
MRPRSSRPQESHDSAFETGFDIAILLLDPDALLIEVQNVSHIVGMTGQIARGSHVGQDRPTEHLFFPPQLTWFVPRNFLKKVKLRLPS